MKQKPVQCMVLCLVLILPGIAFSYQENLKVKVSVKGGCTTTSNDEAHFGEHTSGQPHSILNSTGAVHYWCSVGTRHDIQVDNGQNYSGSSRKMALTPTGGVEIPYDLTYTPPSGVGSGAGNPLKVDVNVALAANALQNVPPGDYEDTVTVTVEP